MFLRRCHRRKNGKVHTYWALVESSRMARGSRQRVVAILTISRFCEPSSELHIEDTWYRRAALEDLLGVSPEKVHTGRFGAKRPTGSKVTS